MAVGRGSTARECGRGLLSIQKNFRFAIKCTLAIGEPNSGRKFYLRMCVGQVLYACNSYELDTFNYCGMFLSRGDLTRTRSTKARASANSRTTQTEKLRKKWIRAEDLRSLRLTDDRQNCVSCVEPLQVGSCAPVTAFVPRPHPRQLQERTGDIQRLAVLTPAHAGPWDASRFTLERHATFVQDQQAGANRLRHGQTVNDFFRLGRRQNTGQRRLCGENVTYCR